MQEDQTCGDPDEVAKDDVTWLAERGIRVGEHEQGTGAEGAK